MFCRRRSGSPSASSSPPGERSLPSSMTTSPRPSRWNKIRRLQTTSGVSPKISSPASPTSLQRYPPRPPVPPPPNPTSPWIWTACAPAMVAPFPKRSVAAALTATSAPIVASPDTSSRPVPGATVVFRPGAFILSPPVTRQTPVINPPRFSIGSPVWHFPHPLDASPYPSYPVW